MEVTLNKAKVTKNMVRYNAPGTVDEQRSAPVPNIYIRQSDLTKMTTGFGFPEIC
jgi:hypothetical protein